MVQIMSCVKFAKYDAYADKEMIRSYHRIDQLAHLLLEKNGRHFAEDIFIHNFLNENVRCFTKISLKFVSKGPIDNNPVLV